MHRAICVSLSPVNLTHRINHHKNVTTRGRNIQALLGGAWTGSHGKRNPSEHEIIQSLWLGDHKLEGKEERELLGRKEDCREGLHV